MAGFTLTSRAKADLMEIGRYTLEQWGREQRNIYLAMLDGCFRQLAANPLKGKDCSEVRSGYRKLKAGGHVIFYRLTSTENIEIVRVLHEGMDLEARLSESGKP